MRIIRGIFLLFLVVLMIFAAIKTRSFDAKTIIVIIIGLVLAVARLMPRRTAVQPDAQVTDSIYGSPERVFCGKGEGRRQRKFAKAVKYCESGEPDKAVSILEELKGQCACDGDYMAVLHALSLAYADGGDTDKSIAVYRDAVEKDKTSARLWDRLARRQLAAGRTEEAIASWKEQMRCADSDPEPYIEVASLRLKQEDYEDAVKHAEKALEISQRSQKAHEILCIACAALGKAEKSAEHQRKYIMFGGSAPHIDHQLSLLKKKEESVG